MSRLYYILANASEGQSGGWKWKGQLGFLTFQWMLFFVCPTVILDSLNACGKIDWYKYDQVKPYVLPATLILICCNYFLFFREKQTNKIIEKYTGKYPLIDKYPGLAYLLFHVIIPIILFILTAFFTKAMTS
jgi:hypothetical protein